MSKLTDKFHAINIINPHAFYERGQVFITYRKGGSLAAGWHVHKRGSQTNPDGHFLDGKDKLFVLFRSSGDTHKERRASALKQAQDWAAEQYGVTEWAKDPFGGYGEASYVKARTAHLKAASADVPARNARVRLKDGREGTLVFRTFPESDLYRIVAEEEGPHGRPRNTYPEVTRDEFEVIE